MEHGWTNEKIFSPKMKRGVANPSFMKIQVWTKLSSLPIVWMLLGHSSATVTVPGDGQCAGQDAENFKEEECIKINAACLTSLAEKASELSEDCLENLWATQFSATDTFSEWGKLFNGKESIMPEDLCGLGTVVRWIASLEEGKVKEFLEKKRCLEKALTTTEFKGIAAAKFATIDTLKVEAASLIKFTDEQIRAMDFTVAPNHLASVLLGEVKMMSDISYASPAIIQVKRFPSKLPDVSAIRSALVANGTKVTLGGLDAKGVANFPADWFEEPKIVSQVEDHLSEIKVRSASLKAHLIYGDLTGYTRTGIEKAVAACTFDEHEENALARKVDTDASLKGAKVLADAKWEVNDEGDNCWRTPLNLDGDTCYKINAACLTTLDTKASELTEDCIGSLDADHFSHPADTFTEWGNVFNGRETKMPPALCRLDTVASWIASLDPSKVKIFVEKPEFLNVLVSTQGFVHMKPEKFAEINAKHVAVERFVWFKDSAIRAIDFTDAPVDHIAAVLVKNQVQKMAEIEPAVDLKIMVSRFPAKLKSEDVKAVKVALVAGGTQVKLSELDAKGVANFPVDWFAEPKISIKSRSIYL